MRYLNCDYRGRMIKCVSAFLVQHKVRKLQYVGDMWPDCFISVSSTVLCARWSPEICAS
jgi:hypothetical protein